MRTLASGDAGVGAHAVEWDGRDDTGTTLASGTYFARLVTQGGDGIAHAGAGPLKPKAPGSTRRPETTTPGSREARPGVSRVRKARTPSGAPGT